MAKRRRATVRRARASPRRAPTYRARSRRKSSSGKLKLLQMDAMAYGAIRAKASNMLLPLTQKIPLGSIADEVGMGFANWMVAKNTSGFLKDMALKGLVIENARLGEAVISGQVGNFTPNANSTGYVYG